MPVATKKSKVPVVMPLARRKFDAQATFQMYRNEKLAINSMIDGRRFKVMGDVLREMMYEYFQNHEIDPSQYLEGKE